MHEDDFSMTKYDFSLNSKINLITILFLDRGLGEAKSGITECIGICVFIGLV